MNVDMLLWIVAAVCFLLAAVGLDQQGRVHLGWLGLLFAAITMIV
jgi:hypothetical protein